MRRGRISRAVGIAVLAVLSLGACATQNSPAPGASTGQASAKQGGKITVVEVNAFNSFNPNTATGNAEINSKVSYPTHSGFYYIDNKLNVVRNEKFGKMEKVSDDPLTVKYTVNDGVKWSDGTPVTAHDLFLQWAAFSAYYSDADPSAKTGTSYFSFAGDPTGLNATEVPTISDNDRTLTLKYTKPYADWEIALGGPAIDVPAHVIAKKAGLPDAKALTDLMRGMKKGDPAKPQPANETLKKAAEFYNTGFDTKTLPADTSLFLSNGPYIVKEIVPDQSMTLIRNRDYAWGPTPNADSIVVRYIGSAPAQVQALKNGEADIIAPQASADTIDQLKSVPGATVLQDKQLAYEHLDLNFSGPFADKDVRTAFLLTVPRQDIVDKIVKKLDPEAKPLDSQFFVPAQAAYANSVKDNGSTAYDNVDIDKAKQLLSGKQPEIRIMYNKDSPNRVDMFTLIKESAEKAGFKIVDGGLGRSDWSKALGKGTYDASIFAWSNPGVGVQGVPAIFKSGNDLNYNKFSNEEADKLMDELIGTTDKGKQNEIMTKLDKIVWDSSYGLPLFQNPGVQAYSDKVDGVVYNPMKTGVWWNFWEWSVK
ncbi:ABC transporter family substrate-binding protein [Sinomonas sp. B1-1]|uniref:ABC transporter family substrate-binding protein n=1 Tax=Sinomonas sp. B1-1 TaxID=3141454 RepID=UPI003D2AFE48